MIQSTPWEKLCIGLLLMEYHSELAYRIAHGVAHGTNRRHLTIRDVYRDVITLEKAGFFLYNVEMVCVGVNKAKVGLNECRGQQELAFVNASWLRGLISS